MRAMHRLSLVLGVGAALVSGSAGAINDFFYWDRDADAALNYREWAAGLEDERLFQRWDRDGDGFLDEAEYGDGLLGHDPRSWDTDGDGRLDRDEVAGGLFTTYNRDGNEVIVELMEYDVFAGDMSEAGYWSGRTS